MQFIQLLVKAKLHEDGDSDENKRLFIRSLIEEYGESETTTPAQPEQPGGEELPVDKKIEARFGRMIMGHLLVPYLKAIKQLNHTGTPIKDLLSKQVFSLMKVMTFLMSLPLYLLVSLPSCSYLCHYFAPHYLCRYLLFGSDMLHYYFAPHYLSRYLLLGSDMLH